MNDRSRNRIAASLAPLVVCSWLAASHAVSAEEPLHRRIDALLASQPLGLGSALATDEEFVRRIHLDLIGMVPEVSETRAFLADSAADKRARLVDRLLDSPHYARHMATTFDVMLTERRRGKEVKHEEWLQFLHEAMVANKPWNRLAAEILGADGTDEKIRAASKFYLDREGEPNLLTRDVGRMFFGIDLGCAQCHDHPLVDAYRQYDYYGLYAFLSRGTMFTDKDKKVFFAETAEGEAKFTSVFTKQQDEMRPRLPGGFELSEPLFLKGEEYAVAPAKDVRPVPKYSRRARLAELVAEGANLPFRRNLANRLWAHVMGRGLVEPLDMHHPDNPPSQPELLNLLADELGRTGFDMKSFLRELVLTQTYQRSIRPPDDLAPRAEIAVARMADFESRSKSAREAEDEAFRAQEEATKAFDQARQVVTAILAEHQKANEPIPAAQKALAEARQAFATTEQELRSIRELQPLVHSAIEKTTRAADVSNATSVRNALTILQERAAKLAADAPALEKSQVEKSTALQAATEKYEAARSVVLAIAARRDAALQQQAEAQRKVAEQDDRLRTARIASEAAKLDLAAARALVEYRERSQAAIAAEQQAAALAALVTQRKQAVAALATQVTGHNAALAAAKGTHAESLAHVQAMQSRREAHQQALPLVEEALARLDLAAQKVPEDDELRQAVVWVKARYDQLVARQSTLKKDLEQEEQSVRLAAEQLATAQRAAGASRDEQTQAVRHVAEAEQQWAELNQRALAARELSLAAFTRATEEGVKRAFIAPLDPLTPEQLGWSIQIVTGIAAQHRAAAAAELAKKSPADAAATEEKRRAF
ncbi:MAG: DUF1549 domain-containing protein, partial [Pirellulaceae bacterium]